MKYMGLCEKQKELVVLITPPLVAGFATIFGLISLGQAIITSFVVDVPMITYVYLRDKRIKKQEKLLTKTNIDVFKLWMNAKKNESEFQIEISIDENIDEVLLKDAIDFLESKRKKYGRILDLRKKIMELKKDYNCIGENIITEINSQLSIAYPSLEPIESRKVTGSENCYVINAIIFLIWYNLRKEFLKEGQISWKTIILEEKKEGNLWRLKVNLQYKYIIQSNNSKDVSKKLFKTTIENLIIKNLSDNLKKQDELHKELTKDLKQFKNEVHTLSIDIETNRV